MKEFDVTIVVCTYNRAALLRDALDSLMSLETGGNFCYEVVVVDNASTDETPTIIAEAARKSPVPLRGVREPRPGVSCARNRGVKEARGPWIAFFDDDQVADPHWLRELLVMAQEKGVRCVAGCNRLRLPSGRPERLLPAVCDLLGESTFLERPRRCGRNNAVPGGNLLIQRSIFDEVGLFDEGLLDAGEDADLSRRMDTAQIEAWRTPRAFLYHLVPSYRLNEGYLRWKALRNGGHLARRNHHEWGRVMFLLVLAARLGQAVGLHLPRLLWAKLRRSEAQCLAARCRLWRAEGYLRFALHSAAPRLFPQRAFFRWLEFRSERDLFQSKAAVEQAVASIARGGL